MHPSTENIGAIEDLPTCVSFDTIAQRGFGPFRVQALFGLSPDRIVVKIVLVDQLSRRFGVRSDTLCSIARKQTERTNSVSAAGYGAVEHGKVALSRGA